ncbi:hypothetical protein M758_6G185500 [Ceratodon purpureus]|nr:hypothetical protein M758_6G185500 [Ceratodon purpureus]
MATSGGGRRTRGVVPEVSARAAALLELKNLKDKGGRRVDTFQVREEEKIYDSLSEADYNLLVQKRREEVKNFVVADDGLGYADIGEEEDWNVDQYSDESGDEDGGGGKKKKKNGDEVKKDVPNRKAAALSAAASLIGKQRLASMFTSASGIPSLGRRMRDDKGVSTESILDDVLADISADDFDREREKRRRRASIRTSTAGQDVVFQPAPERLILDNVGKPTFESQNVHSSHPIMDIPVSDHLEDADVLDDLPVVTTVSGHDQDPLENTDQTVQAKDVGREELDKKVSDDMSARLKLEKDAAPIVLNAKISKVEDTGKGATAAWHAISKGVTENSATAVIKKEEDSNDRILCDGSSLPLDAEGRLPFFLIDAHEEPYGANPGTVYMFGKVPVGGRYESCCVVVRNMQRCVYAVPNPSVFPPNTIAELEQLVSSDQPEEKAMFRVKLQELATDLKQELAEKLVDLDVVKFTMYPVKRSYAFECPEVPTGENYVMKLTYSFQNPSLPSDLKGRNFVKVLGTHTSALELMLIKKRIKGPCWLSIAQPQRVTSSSQISWCKMEVNVEDPKDFMVAASGKGPSGIPPLTVASLNLKTVINHKQNVNEIASVSVVYCKRVKVDAPMPLAEWNNRDMLNHFSIVRKLDGGIYPMGFVSEVAKINTNTPNTLNAESSERALLNLLMVKLHQLDADVLVGHNISGFDLDILLHRLQANKVASNQWSKIGRLKRSVMPRLNGGGSTFGSGASPGALTCLAGRLLCDTYLSSRELLREVSYSLTQLAKSQLGRERKELMPSQIPGMYGNSSSLLELIESGETDAWLSLGLMFHLSVLPLTRQLTNISGNLWSKTLQGNRAQRVEYLLLHEFHLRKFILPDKLSQKEKEKEAGKRKAPVLADTDLQADGEDGDNREIASDNVHGKKGKKGPAYLGGLVLEPKKGLYDKYILLLDFNSLYPSIIQEYNICFTTVEKAATGSIPSIPSSEVPGVLPQVLKGLVERRKQVKGWLKRTTDILKYQQFDIQQQALKLTANSMYGCLGFTNSRFYAKPIAELITAQGREILQSTVDLVQNSLNLEVIYGDTDSIMIHSGLEDLAAAKAIAVKVIKEVNKKYRLLEIDLDGVYKRMLLLKKKKYAAVKVQSNSDGSVTEVIEQKGLDIVRRDWSSLSKEIGNYCLEQILSGGSREEVVDSIHAQLRKLQEEMRKGDIELDKYIITKSLTKQPEDYPDAKNQPHVQVALRRKQNGHRISPSDTVPYIICIEKGSEGPQSGGIADRARHPDELKEENSNWLIDVEYYICHQIHPVVSRLCAPIEGTDAGHIADCLGLDSSKFLQRQSATTIDTDSARLTSASMLEDDDRYKLCEPLELVCAQCYKKYAFAGISEILAARATSNETPSTSAACPDPLMCTECNRSGGLNRMSPAMLANQVKLRADEFIKRYYECWMMCDDEMCGHITRNITLQRVGDAEKGTVCPLYPRCTGRLHRQYTEAHLYNQLTQFYRLLDASRVLEKVILLPL